MFRVSLRSSSSKSLDTVRAKINEITPRMIPRGKLIEPKTMMKAKVRAALNMPMMNDRITK